MGATLISWLSALAIGLSLGLFGSGGSIITVPALIYLFGQNEKIAIAGSLAIVGSIALVGSAAYLRKQLIDWRMALLFGLPAMAGTYIGAALSIYISGLVQLILFAVIMLLASTLMLKPLKLDAAGPQIKRSIIKINLDGLIVGIVTGLVGVGGGFLIVPALVLLGGLGMHKAVATSLIIVALKSFTGFFKYIDVLAKQDLSLDWEVIGLVSGLGIVGSFIGSAFATKLPQAKLRRGFAIFLILMGLYILIQSISQLG